MTRAVLFAGGWAHPGQDLVAAAKALTSDRGIDLAVVHDPLKAPQALARGCDLLIVGSCWFGMADDRYTPQQRDEFAVQLTPDLATALQRLRHDGCPLLALHTAVICFDGDSIWTDWLGGAWNWETSWHPEPAAMLIKPAPGTSVDFEAFTVTDELYQQLDVDSGVVHIAESAAGDPLVWLNQQEGARVAVNLLGHDHRSLDHPGHRALNAALLDWLLDGQSSGVPDQ